MKIRKGDNVIVLTGKDRGKSGKVLQSLPKNEQVVVESINLRKKHSRPRKQGEKGQMIEKSFPCIFPMFSFYVRNVQNLPVSVLRLMAKINPECARNASYILK